MKLKTHIIFSVKNLKIVFDITPFLLCESRCSEISI